MSRVLYISYDGMSDPLGQSQVLPYLRGLSAKGHRISLISFEKKSRLLGAEEQLQEQMADASIRWIPLPYHGSPPVLSSIYDLQLMKRKALVAARDEDAEIVHCRGYLPAMAGLYVKRKTGAKLLFDMRGFWPDERVDGGLWPQNNPVYRSVYHFFKKEERKLLQEADHSISLTEAGKKMIRQELAGPEVPVTVIPTCTDLSRFDPAAVSAETRAARRAEAEIPEECLVLGYVGSTGTWYMLREMLQFFKKVMENRKALLLFISRDDPEAIFRQAQDLGISREALRIRPAAYESVPVWISLFDYGLFFIRPGFSKQASSPTKMGEILAMGKPVICNAGVGDVAALVEKYKVGTALETLSEECFEWAAEVYLNKERRDPAHYRKAAIDWFSLEKGVEKYDDLYQKLSNL